MNIRGTRVFLLLFLLVALCAVATAQSDRGSITGTVQDGTGAVVPNAKITATDRATGETRNTTSSASGSYLLPELKASVWTLTVEAPGFSSAKYESFKVAVGTTHTLDIKLAVGAKAETVNVEASAPIETESAVLSTNVTERQVRELPLQVTAEIAGRSPLGFIFLDSNVTSSDNGRQQSASSFRVNGGQALGADILIDGANTRRAQNGSFFTEVAPGPDAFQEFTYNTTNYSAEFGNSSSGVVNFTLKSGTNSLHGEGYEHFTNEALDANRWAAGLSNPAQRKGRDRQNDFGFNLGGPVKIPGVYDGHNKTFFFNNFNAYRFTLSENRLLSIPTAKMRTGDFSELLTDPDVLRVMGGPVMIWDPHMDPNARVAGTQIPGNRLDTYNGGALLDPIGLAIMKAYPNPTSSGVFHNYQSNSSVPTNMNSDVAKIDHILSDKQRLSGSYSYRKQTAIKGGAPRMPSPAVATGVWDQVFKSHYARLQHDYTLSPTLLNHINIGWNRVWVANLNSTYGFDPRTLGMPANATANLTFPMIEYWDPGMGSDLTDPRNVQGIGSTWWHDQMGDNSVEFADGVTWQRGKHTLKFGADIRIQQLNMFQNFDNGGHFQFSNEQTRGIPDGSGWNLASLATGAARLSWVTITSTKPAYRFFTQGYYFNDDFKLTPRLTLNLGLRYEVQSPRTEAHNQYRAFDPTAINPIVNRPGAIVSADGRGVSGSPNGLIETDYTDIAPRFGFAYALSSKTAVRGGIGAYYSPFLYGAGGGTQGYRAARFLQPDWGGFGGRGWMTPGVYLKAMPAAPITDPEGQYIGSDVEYFQRDAKAGRTVQWNLDIQRELPGNFVMTAAYIGNKGTRLRSNLGRLNAAPLNVLKLGFPLLQKNINDVTAADRAYASSVGVTIPDSAAAVFAGFNGSVAQALRPFPQYNLVNNGVENRGQSWYHAMNLKVERRFSAGIQFTGSYTWSRLETTASDDLQGNSPLNGVLQNPFDTKSLRALSSTNANHVLAFGYNVELPFGKGKRFLNTGGVLNQVFGGWQLNGTHRYQSGLPVVVSINGGDYRGFLDMVGYNGNLRPNLGSGNARVNYTPSGALVTVINAAGFSAPKQYSAAPAGAIGSAAYSAYYNVDPTSWFGTAPAVLNNRVLPYYTENFSMLKKFSLTESRYFEFGAEFFNLFNRHRYYMPDTNLDVPSTTTGTGWANRNFGVSSVQDPGDPRVIQLRARFVF